jgi:uncharacterized protein YcfL
MDMKRISYLFFLLFLISLFASSCSNTQTYAQLLDDEQTLISSYIKRNNIQVVSTFPTDSVWVKNGKDIYVKTTSGLYFHLVDHGDLANNDTLEIKNTVVDRYKKYTLNVVSDTLSNWNTIDFPIPDQFIYGNTSQSFSGFQETVSYMKRNNSIAKVIIPSKIGLKADMLSVTPYGYLIKIKILK